MNNREERQSKWSGLVALVSFALFAVCILSVLFTGAKVYQGRTGRGRTTYHWRTAVQYLTTKVRQADEAGRVYVDEFAGLDALVLEEEIEGEVYLTKIYCYDGYIRELFAAADGKFGPEAGEKILEAEALLAREDGTAVCLELAGPDGRTEEIRLQIRSGREVGQ